MSLRRQYYKAQDRLDGLLGTRNLLSSVPIQENCSSIGYVCHAGMANRLRAHIIAEYLADLSGRHLATYWPINKHCGARYTELFVPRESAIYRQSKYTVIPFNDSASCLTIAAKTIADSAGKFVILDHGWQYAPIEVLRTCISVLRGSPTPILQPIEEVTVALNAEIAGWPGSMLGIHLRQGDFVRIGRAIPVQRFGDGARRILNERPDLRGIFLATDATQTSVLAPLLSLEIPVLRREVEGRASMTGVLSALVDLLLLSHTKTLLLSPGSSFGELAALLGDVPFTVA